MCKSPTSQRTTRKCRDFRTGLVCAGQRSGSAVKDGGRARRDCRQRQENCGSCSTKQISETNKNKRATRVKKEAAKKRCNSKRSIKCGSAYRVMCQQIPCKWRSSRVTQLEILSKLAFFSLQLKHPFNAFTNRVSEIPSRIFQFSVVYFLSYFAASYLWLMQHSLWLSLSQVWQQGVTSGIALKMQIQLDFNFSYLGLCPLSRIKLICKCISIQLTVKFKCAFANVNSISARSHEEKAREE